MKRIRIKICCISSRTEAALAVEAGADALGLVGRMPSGPGTLTDDVIGDLVQSVPPPISSFLLTSETNANNIIAHYHRTHASTIQLVDELQQREYARIRQALPHVKLVQVIHVIDEGSVREAKEIAGAVDALLLDSGNPRLSVKELGGTGRTHNWAFSREICDAVSIPVFLAGGLNAGNVLKAIRTVRPFGVDVCSGVRTDERLDAIKLRAFVEEVRKATEDQENEKEKE